MTERALHNRAELRRRNEWTDGIGDLDDDEDPDIIMMHNGAAPACG